MSLRRGIVPTAELDAASTRSGGATLASSQEDKVVPVEPWPGWPRQMNWNPEHELQKRERVCNIPRTRTCCV